MAVAGLNGPVDWRGTTPAWQHRAMDIEATPHPRAGHGIQHPLGQDQTVGGDHHGGCSVVGNRMGDRLLRRLGFFRVGSVSAQAVRLGQRYGVFEGKLLDGRGLHFHAASCGPIGLRQDQGDAVACRV